MNALVALFSIASLIWLVPIVQQGRLLAIAMLTLGVGTVFGPYFFAIEGPMQISLDRILWVAMLILCIAGWRFGQIHLVGMTRMDWMMLALVVWMLGCSLGGGPTLPNSSPPLARWLFYFAMPAGMYVIARIVPVLRTDVQWLQRGIIGLGFYLSITALLETSGLHTFVLPSYIVDPEYWEFFGRGRGPLMNPAGNGFVMSIALTACMVRLIQTNRRGKLLCIVALLILPCGLYATMTRSVWLGGIATLAIVGLVYSPKVVRILGIVLVFILLCVSALGVKDQIIRMKRDKNLSAAEAEKSIKLRPLLAIVAWEMFKDRPMTGHGLARYEQHRGPFHTERRYGLPLEQARNYVQHNVFLSILVDTGLIGLGILVSWMIMIAAIAWKLARHRQSWPETRSIGVLMLGALLAYISNGMFHDVSIIPMTHMFLFFIAGITVSVHQYGLAKTPQRTGRVEPVSLDLIPTT